MTVDTTTLGGPETIAADGPFGRLAAGDWLATTGVAGLSVFTPKFEAVMARLHQALTSVDPAGSAGPSWYPPVIERAVIERAQYAEAFPHLLGTVHALEADTVKDDGFEESDRYPTDVVLAPAVCYSVYAGLADSVVEEPRLFDVAGYCYRHEATSELGRFRSFRMREFVLVADEDTALTWRDGWLDRCRTLFAGLGLAVSVESATDPFFGPGGRFMRASQIQQNLKYELIAPVSGQDRGTAIASANCHKDHLGIRFGMDFADRGPAHTSCTAFGLERIVLALIHVHGDNLAEWPEQLV